MPANLHRRATAAVGERHGVQHTGAAAQHVRGVAAVSDGYGDRVRIEIDRSFDRSGGCVEDSEVARLPAVDHDQPAAADIERHGP